MRIWQAVSLISLWVAFSGSAESAEKIAWKGPKVKVSQFSPDIGMLNSERDEYATNLAALAINRVVKDKASADSLDEARKMIALALQLSPRNKRAVVANFQLGKGVLPEPVEESYGRESFSRLLLTRGQLLEKDSSAENVRLARLFVNLAATLDPRNEDAVYASEVHRLDHGEPDWGQIMESPVKK